MGRELRRKEAKKNGRNLKEVKVEEKTNWRKIIIIRSIIIIFFVLLYFILAIFVTKELDFSKKSNENVSGESASNVTNAILASNIFKQKEDVYYVYFFDFDDQDTGVSTVISDKLINDTVYRVNTSDSLNSKYVGEESNKDASSLDDLKVVNPTLLRIENGKITMFLSGKDEIVNNYK